MRISAPLHNKAPSQSCCITSKNWECRSRSPRDLCTSSLLSFARSHLNADGELCQDMVLAQLRMTYVKKWCQHSERPMGLRLSSLLMFTRSYLKAEGELRQELGVAKSKSEGLAQQLKELKEIFQLDREEASKRY